MTHQVGLLGEVTGLHPLFDIPPIIRHPPGPKRQAHDKAAPRSLWSARNGERRSA
jgi:hypothetical protein